MRRLMMFAVLALGVQFAVRAVPPVPVTEINGSELSAAFHVTFDRLPSAESPVKGPFEVTAEADGRLTVRFFAEATDLAGDFVCSTTTKVKAGEWHHVAFTYSLIRRRVTLPESWKTKKVFLRFDAVYPCARFYLNGELADSLNVNGGLAWPSDSAAWTYVIGGDSFNGGSGYEACFTGRIAAANIYSSVLNVDLGMFYNQTEEEIGNTPYFDAFVNAQWQIVSVFVKYTNALIGWPQADYFSAYHYIRPARGFKFGVYWPF